MTNINQFKYLSSDWFYCEIGRGRNMYDVMLEVNANVFGEETAEVLNESFLKTGKIIKEVN